MPKILQLTLELNIQKVSCPGVWLCQDGRVSLTLLALGTSYQTCLLPPVFPLHFRDVFYFRKRFKQNCALNNICCLLKDETIYCELVQWADDCESGPCTVLAQYLGSLNDVLFPPNMCWSDGVDLLMRRCKHFPGILAPKIEISTKIRIEDEVSDFADSLENVPVNLSKSCGCEAKLCENNADGARQKTVCHSPMYHSYRHNMAHNERTGPRPKRTSDEKYHSEISCTNMSPCVEKFTKSYCKSPGVSEKVSLHVQTIDSKEGSITIIDDFGQNVNNSDFLYPIPEYSDEELYDDSKSCTIMCDVETANQKPSMDDVTETGVGTVDCDERYVDEESFPSAILNTISESKLSTFRQDYEVYSVHSSDVEDIKVQEPVLKNLEEKNIDFSGEYTRPVRLQNNWPSPTTEVYRPNKTLLESRFVEAPLPKISDFPKQNNMMRTEVRHKPCVCEICKRYHELFHDKVSW